MNEELESLFVTLHMNVDEASVASSVNDMIKKVQSKLKSSVYGGENGVITLPATIEGTYKNGREIEKEIKDAYATIYNKAKQMADESVSLTLKDIEDFKNQINKFSKLTSKKNANNTIANANNNLRQTLSDYQDFVNDLRKQVSVQKTQLAKSTPKKKTAYDKYLDKQEKYSRDAQGAGKIVELKKELEEVRNNKSLTKSSSDIGESSTDARSLRLSEFSPYGSIGAYVEAKHRREEDKKSAASLVSYINKSMAENAPKGKRTTREEQDRFMNSATLRKFGASLVDLGKGKEGVTPDTVYQNLVITLQQWASTGKDLESTFIAIKNMMEAPKSDNPLRRLGGTSGKLKGVGVNDEEAKATARTINRALSQIWSSSELKETLGFAREFRHEVEEATKNVKETVKETKKSRSTKSGENSQHAKREQELLNNSNNDELVNTIKNTEDKISGKINETKTETIKQRTNDEKEYMQVVRESSREGTADTAEAQKNQQLIDKTINNANTGTDSEAGKNEVIKAIKETEKGKTEFPAEQVKNVLANLGQTKQTDEKCPCQSILENIRDTVQTINNKIIGKLGIEKNAFNQNKKDRKNMLPAIIPPDTTKALITVLKKSNFLDLYRYFKDGKWLTAEVIDHDERKPTALHDNTDWDKIRRQRQKNDIEREREDAIEKNATRSNSVQLSQDLAFAYKSRSVLSSIKKAFGIIDFGPNASDILSMNQAQIEKIRADREAIFGIPGNNRLGSNGDIIQAQRRKSVYNWRENGSNPFADLKLTEGINIDSKAITDALQTAVEKNQFNAQTGGILRNIVGSMSFYAGMPSLEKTRAQAEGMNSVMAEIRNAALSLLQIIQDQETSLRGMEAKGTAKFDKNGMLMPGSSPEAQTRFAQMEDTKMALRGVLAEAKMANTMVERIGWNVPKIIKSLGFAAPELKKCNIILQNLNAGLDKNGKALKFQKRSAEVLNYSFQLMAKHVGQMIKNWMLMINPINLIKRAFQDFASYDVKWRRTMNVIKYNLRRIVRPMMEWIAQQIVNIIGLVNALMKGIGKVFNQNWDLFDQSAASAEQMKEELEQAANVTAGFDELHDIGGESGSGDPAMDLMGDIYTPQWDGLNKILEDIGETIGNIINAVSDWNFWDWLKLAGLALGGYLALKWLIGLFTGGTNPLQTVAKGFSFLEKAVGWAILIWAFTEFTKALTDFVECMKNAEWEDIGKSLTMLGGALLELGVVLVALIGFAKLFGTTFLTSLGLAAIVAAFSLFVYVLTQFIETTKGMTEDDVINALALLGGALLELTLVLVTLSAVFTALVATGYGTIALAFLTAILAVVALVILALAELVKSFKDCGDDIKLALEGLAEVVRAFGDAVVNIVTAIGNVITGVITSILNGIANIITSILDGIANIITSILEGIANIIKTIGETIVNVITAIVEGISTIISTVGETIQGIVSTVAEAIVNIINSIADTFKTVGETICQIVETIAGAISTTVEAIATGIMTVLQPILDFIDSIIGKITELATTIVHEVGETIRSVVKTVGDVILGIIDAIVGAIPKLLKSIVDFCHDIGPAIENSVDAICRSVTKLVNFVVSAVEYLANLVIGAINKLSIQIPDWIPGIGGQRWGFNLQEIEIPRFVPQYEQGTNYVPNDGLAYLHQGEAVVPKKYNQPYQQGMSTEEKVYMQQMIAMIRSLDNTMKQGIPVNGEFKQRGSDLVAVVNKTKSQTGADLLSNIAYAR